MTNKDSSISNSNIGLRYVPTSIRAAISSHEFLRPLANCDSLLEKEFDRDITDLYTLDSQLRKTIRSIELLPKQLKLLDHNHLKSSPLLQEFTQNAPKSLAQNRSLLSTKLDAFRDKYLRAHRGYKLPLEVKILYSCSGCGMMYVKWPGGKCKVCGGKIDRNRDALSVQLLDQTMKNYIERNIWLEDAVARVLRKYEFKDVLSGQSYVGRSGVSHEVDVLGIVDGKVLVCECTIGRADFDKVSSLLLKKTDLAANMGLLVTTSDVPRDAERVARAYGVVVVQNVIERPESLEEVVLDISQRISYDAPG